MTDYASIKELMRQLDAARSRLQSAEAVVDAVTEGDGAYQIARAYRQQYEERGNG